MLTIKEYAEQAGKTVQAVYKQLRSKDNAAALVGHITTVRSQGRPMQLLDDEAIRILDASSAQSPHVVIHQADTDKIEELERENKQLLAKIVELQDQIIESKDQLIQSEYNKALAESQAAKLEAAEADKAAAQQEAAAEKAAREAAEAKLQALQHRGLIARVLNRSL